MMRNSYWKVVGKGEERDEVIARVTAKAVTDRLTGKWHSGYLLGFKGKAYYAYKAKGWVVKRRMFNEAMEEADTVEMVTRRLV